MYDLHNHLLPGIDDGAPDIEASIKLARIAVEDGITHMVCTPHIHPGRFENNLQTINSALGLFKSALQKENIHLSVAAAAEVRIGPEILPWVMQGKIPFLGSYEGKKVLLLEFPSNAIPVGTDKLIKWLFANGVVPMIAHPERNSVFQEHPERLHSFTQQGCLAQVTGSAFTGNFGVEAKRAAEYFLQQKQISIIASDAHNLEYRPPLLSKSYSEVVRLSSPDMANKLFLENPQQISQSKFSERLS